MTIYKKIITAIPCLLFLLSTEAQQLTPQTINSGGSNKTAAGIVLEDALGGLLVNTVSTTSFMYTQDFLQPDGGVVTSLPPINNVILNSGTGIDNAGTTFINGGIMLEFTMGEMASISYTNSDKMLTQGILQPFNVSGTVPVTGLEFYAKRLSKNSVQLEWKTLQEINNKGFHVERKKENENNFSAIGFVKSNGINGNSNFRIDYQQLDNNSYTGTTYYRLKQEDLDGRTKYSVVRLVKGDISNQLTMQVWPIPATGYFNVKVTGMEKDDQLLIFDMNGRMIQKHLIQNQFQLRVNVLPAGTYFVKLASDKSIGQKVIIQ